MSALLYWKERLLTGMPFYSSGSYISGVNLKPNRAKPDAAWPHSVARSAIYSDYCIWHREQYLPRFKDQPHYQEYPQDLPEMADELGFFSTIAPWLYVVGKPRQVRSYSVVDRQFHAGMWVETKRKKYFVRLCPLDVHIAAFELFTGSDITASPRQDLDGPLIRVLAEAQQECRETTERNRAFVPSVS